MLMPSRARHCPLAPATRSAEHGHVARPLGRFHAMPRSSLRYDVGVEERAACALLKQRFEAAGFTIEDNRPFDEDGIRFEIDGFDAQHRVGYEYASEEAGDSWDVDDAVIAA